MLGGHGAAAAFGTVFLSVDKNWPMASGDETRGLRLSQDVLKRKVVEVEKVWSCSEDAKV